MKLLFKTIKSASDPKIDDTNFVDHYPSIHDSMSFRSIKPHIRQVTKNQILKYIDRTTYDALAAAFHDDTLTDGSDEAELVEKLQDAIAYYAVSELMLHKNVIISDKGVQQTTSQENRSQPAAAWAVKSAKWEIARRADDLFDEVLLFMEQKKNEAFLSGWVASTAYSAGKSTFFANTSDLQQYIDIRNSLRTFIALIPFLEKAARKYVLPILCTDQYDDLAQKYRDGDGSDDEKALISKVQAVIAEFGALLALPHLAIVMEESGFKVISESDGMTQRSNMSNTQHMQSVERLKYQLEADGQTFRADMISYVYENIDTFTLVKNSACYNEEDDDDLGIYDSPVGGILLN